MEGKKERAKEGRKEEKIIMERKGREGKMMKRRMKGEDERLKRMPIGGARTR